VSELAIYGSMVLAGLAGSLHCVGMCGPILVGFSRLFEGSRGDSGSARRSMTGDFFCYHAGRIWTYGMLGFAAGWAGEGLRRGAAGLGWQRPAALVLSVSVVTAGLALLLATPGGRFETLLDGCGMGRVRQSAWFRHLVEGNGYFPRFLLGAVMGFLPCGLVWAMLVVAAALPGPLHSALGMLVFGAGTVPSLSAVLLLDRAIPARFRIQGTRLAAVALIVVGSLMTVRSIIDVTSHHH